jgi:hypothetical protein
MLVRQKPLYIELIDHQKSDTPCAATPLTNSHAVQDR